MANGQTDPVDVPRGSLRDQALTDLDALIAAIAEAHRDLTLFQTALEKNRQHLAEGGRASDMTTLFNVATVRMTLTDRLNRIERLRSTSRLALWRLQVTEGTTIAEIARGWGFSRQLVSRALATEDSDADLPEQ